ncbi:hypothetical protein [Streptomyces asiaticus]
MPRKSLPTRLAATAALLLAAGALSAPAASAKPTDASPGDAYVLNVSTNPTSTDYDNRRVDVTGTVTKADGTPAPNFPVTVQEVVLFTTWNPWGDPIDPNYYEPRDLGTPVTDANGKFTIPDVDIDHVGGSSLLTSRSRSPTPRSPAHSRSPPDDGTSERGRVGRGMAPAALAVRSVTPEAEDRCERGPRQGVGHEPEAEPGGERSRPGRPNRVLRWATARVSPSAMSVLRSVHPGTGGSAR